MAYLYIFDGNTVHIWPPNKEPDHKFIRRQTEKIAAQIDSLNKKITSDSRERLTNTYRRQNIQAQVDKRVLQMKDDLNLLLYLAHKAETGALTEFEASLFTASVRDDFSHYYTRHSYLKEKPGSAAKGIGYPTVPEAACEEYVNSAKKAIGRLKRIGITTTGQLWAAIELYGMLKNAVSNPIEYQKAKINQMINAARLRQKGDVQFTPQKIAAKLVELAGIEHGDHVLEPEAGIGFIADEIKKVTPHVDCVETACDFRDILELKGHNLVAWDIFDYNPGPVYDAVIMNPPFTNNSDIQHIQHVFKMLKPGGVLVAITSRHWQYAVDKATAKLRKWMEERIAYEPEKLDMGTFEATGTASLICMIEREEMKEAV